MGSIDLRFLQLNCQRSYVVMCELGQAIRSLGAAFALVQEPYATDGQIRGLPGGMRAFTDTGVKAAVIVGRDDVDCTVVSASEFGVCVSVEGSFGRFLICSLYCRYGGPLEPYLGYMESVLLLAGGLPLILGLDANACSRLWHSKMSRDAPAHQNYARGLLLSEWLIANGAHVLNEPSNLYTFDGPRGVSDIDVTLANGVAVSNFSFEWSIRDDWGVSDHNLIQVMIRQAGRSVEQDGIRRWGRPSVNWDNYAGFFREIALEVPLAEFSALSVDEKVARLDEWLCYTNDTLLGRRRRPRLGKVKWWTDELSAMRRRVRHLRSLYQRGRNSGAPDLAQRKAAFSAELRAYKAEIAKVKEAEWRGFVRENRDDPWGRVYRICRGRGNRSDVSSISVDGRVLMSWGECVEALMTHFFPGTDDQLPPVLLENAAPPALERDEVVGSISRVRCRKSPGMDGMTGEMCKSIWKAIPEYLEALFGQCLDEGHFPGAWKIARVVVLLKSPDKVRSNPGSYRGISLLPVLGKVLERIMVSRLGQLDGAGTSEYQFGFREGRSVEDALMHVRNSVDASSSKYVLGIFVDFRGAFDYLDWGAIMRRLEQIGCRELRLWRSYFTSRKACVIGANGAVWRDVARGCPQGSICGPFIWNLMMDTLLRSLAGSFGLCAYADDLVILVEGQSRVDLETRGGQAMNIVEDWGANVGVAVSREKTVMMLLKGRLSHSRPPVIHSGGVSLRYVTQVKYLGLVMSERMNFLVHLAHIRSKLVSVAGLLRRVLRSDWGLSRRAARIIYEGLFVACATFGAPVWYGAVTTVKGREKILSCQRVALLASLPVCRTVSTEALQVLMGVAPLDLEVIRRAISFRIKKGLPLLGSDWVSSDQVVGLDRVQVKEILNSSLVDRWQDRWDASGTGRVTYAFVRNVTFVRDHPHFSFGLGLGFFLTGHGSFNAFLHSRGLSESSRCSCGADAEDWLHLLTVCPLYEDIRDLVSMGIVRTGDSYDFSNVLVDPRTLRLLGDFARVALNRRRVGGP